jgi:hypothetical protein
VLDLLRQTSYSNAGWAGLYIGQIDVIDLNRGEVVASVQSPNLLLNFIGDGLIIEPHVNRIARATSGG